ncbi:MAG: hypothetical protein QXL65_02080 [Candidatus Caldarchaeum sp.]
MHEWWIDGDTGLPQETAEKIKKKIQQVENETSLLAQKIGDVENRVKIIEVSGAEYAVGSAVNPLSDVVTQNITIISEKERKTDIREIDDEELEVALPRPKIYKIGDKEFIGFLAEEMPEKIKTQQGYSLNMLIALLVHKIQRLEKEVKRLENSRAFG